MVWLLSIHMHGLRRLFGCRLRLFVVCIVLWRVQYFDCFLSGHGQCYYHFPAKKASCAVKGRKLFDEVKKVNPNPLRCRSEETSTHKSKLLPTLALAVAPFSLKEDPQDKSGSECTPMKEHNEEDLAPQNGPTPCTNSDAKVPLHSEAFRSRKMWSAVQLTRQISKENDRLPAELGKSPQQSCVLVLDGSNNSKPYADCFGLGCS